LTSWRALLVAIVALAGVSAGCGGGDALSKQEYQQELSQAATDLSEASQTLGRELSNAAIGEGSFDEAADEMAAIREQLDQTADDLDGLDPPDDAEDAHNRLVDSLHAYSDDLEEIQGKLESGSDAEITESLRGLQNLDSVKDLQQAGADLEELGYRFETM
jgi:septal ring factor EnvC (AmiA/AmiB activator)